MNLIEPELSYKIVGCAFDVYNSIGLGLRELHYQRALSESMRRRGLQFIEQFPVDLYFKDSKIGKYYLDFLVDGKIVVEIKRGDYFAKTNIEQALGYLKSLNLRLGLLINFTSTGVRYKRIVNLY